MICRLCLGEFAYLLNLFDEEVYELSKAYILQQHFWFELTPNDPVSTFICRDCWNKVDDFHQFYKSVQVTHSVHYASGFHGAAVRTESITNELVAKQNPMEVFIIKEEITDEEPSRKSVANRNENQELLQLSRTASETCNGDQTAPGAGYAENVQENERKLIKKHMVMICELCAVIFDDFLEIVEHFREQHPCKVPFVKCCGVKLKYYDAVLLHAQKHEDPEFLKSHSIIQDASAESEEFECKRCHQHFARRLLLNLHLASHLPESSLQSEELSPPNAFENETYLKIHSAQEGTNKKPQYNGQVSGKDFEYKVDYDNQMHQHSVISSPRVECPVPDCCKSLATIQTLKTHMRTSHEDAKSKCDQCGMMSKSAHALAVHKRRIHNLAVVHSCEICGKTFKRSTFLKEHRAMHAGVSLNNCRFCARTFTFQSNMYGHMRKMHREEYETWREVRQYNRFHSIAAPIL